MCGREKLLIYWPRHERGREKCWCFTISFTGMPQSPKTLLVPGMGTKVPGSLHGPLRSVHFSKRLSAPLNWKQLTSCTGYSSCSDGIWQQIHFLIWEGFELWLQLNPDWWREELSPYCPAAVANKHQPLNYEWKTRMYPWMRESTGVENVHLGQYFLPWFLFFHSSPQHWFLIL